MKGHSYINRFVSCNVKLTFKRRGVEWSLSLTLYIGLYSVAEPMEEAKRTAL